jgi:hypothetical protein
MVNFAEYVDVNAYFTLLVIFTNIITMAVIGIPCAKEPSERRL